ncbi:MAG: hypothetical protein IJ097_05060 [Bacilli bacterium]|nr:hypothetical protein [Bacilli bacterium]
MNKALEIMKLMDEIEYGWVDKKNNRHIKLQGFADNYMLQSPKELINSKLGVCWDQVELERFYFKERNIVVNSYFIVHYDDNKCPCHTFISFEENNKFYWFEHAWKKHKGIKEFNTEKELLNEVKSKFIDMELNNEYQENHLFIYQYEEPKIHIDVEEFYKHCEKGKKVKPE